MGRGDIIQSPSGAFVEVKSVGDCVTTVYQLNELNERITELKIDGTEGYLLGLILNDNICAR